MQGKQPNLGEFIHISLSFQRYNKRTIISSVIPDLIRDPVF